jgi:hypothetical protein
MAFIDYWKPLLIEAGLWATGYDALNILLLAGAVMDDPEVAELRRREEFIVRDPNYPASVDVQWKKLFEHLGPEGRAQLHARLKAKAAAKP